MDRPDGDAVAAIAGEKAADASNAVADGGGWSGQIQGAQHADFGPPALDEQRGDAEEEAAKPGESVRLPQNAPSQIAKLDGGVDDVPQLGAHHAGHQGHDNHAQGVGGNARATEAAVHDKSRHHGGQPHHQPEGRLIPVEEVQIEVKKRQHTLKV